MNPSYSVVILRLRITAEVYTIGDHPLFAVIVISEAPLILILAAVAPVWSHEYALPMSHPDDTAISMIRYLESLSKKGCGREKSVPVDPFPY